MKPEELLARDETSAKKRIQKLLAEEADAKKRVDILRAQCGEEFLKQHIDSLKNEISTLEQHATRLRIIIERLETALRSLEESFHSRDEVAKMITGVLLTGVEMLVSQVETLSSGAKSSVTTLEENAEALKASGLALKRLSDEREKVNQELGALEALQAQGRHSYASEIAAKREELAFIAEASLKERQNHDTYSRWHENLEVRNHDLNVLADRVRPLYKLISGGSTLNDAAFTSCLSTL